MGPAASVNNDGRTDHLRLSHLTALPDGVKVHSQRISGFLANSNAWSNNFDTIFWSNVPTSDASGVDDITTRKKARSCLFATDVPLLTHRWKWLDFLFSSVRYRSNIYIFVNTLDCQIEVYACLFILHFLPPWTHLIRARTYNPRFNKVERGVYWYHLVRLSVCGQNRVRSVSSTILIRSISYLHILSSNFRRCVACNACFKIKKFEILANFF